MLMYHCHDSPGTVFAVEVHCWKGESHPTLLEKCLCATTIDQTIFDFTTIYKFKFTWSNIWWRNAKQYWEIKSSHFKNFNIWKIFHKSKLLIKIVNLTEHWPSVIPIVSKFCNTIMWAFIEAKSWQGLIGCSDDEINVWIDCVSWDSSCCARYSRGANMWSDTTTCLETKRIYIIF